MATADYKVDLSTWSIEKLKRKYYQAHDMAALARVDNDTKDMQRRLAEAEEIRCELRERR